MGITPFQVIQSPRAIIENVILAGTLNAVIDGSLLTNPPDRPISSLTSRRREHTWHGIFGPVLKHPNYGALTSTPAGLFPAEHASIYWTHNRTCSFPAYGSHLGCLTAGLRPPYALPRR